LPNLDKLRKQAAIYAAGEKPLHLLNQIEAEEIGMTWGLGLCPPVPMLSYPRY